LIRTIVVIIWILILFVFFIYHMIHTYFSLWFCLRALIYAVTFRTIKPRYEGLNSGFKVHFFLDTARDALTGSSGKSIPIRTAAAGEDVSPLPTGKVVADTPQSSHAA
jgi:hypothetical protein